MGCDGGTIPTRDELVKLKRKPEQRDKDGHRLFRWQHCAISQQPLRKPVMACELGKLYNKESIIGMFVFSFVKNFWDFILLRCWMIDELLRCCMISENLLVVLFLVCVFSSASIAYFFCFHFFSTQFWQ
jgi:hypothetical protein